MMNLKNILDKHINNYNLESQKYSSRNLNSKLKVSIVIPVFNSESTLRYCVDSVIKQEDVNYIKEIIIIDDKSEDKSLLIAEELSLRYKKKLNIIINKNHKRKYASFCRNVGIKTSSSDLVLFIDSDIIVPPNFVREHILIHQSLGNCIVFSLRSDIKMSKVPKISFPVKNISSDFRYTILRKNNFLKNSKYFLEKGLTLADLCLTCAISYKRDDVALVKGCPENFVGWGYNDTAMAAKVIALGRKVVPAINATVYHIKHKPRSGNVRIKKIEHNINGKRYQKMINMPFLETFKYRIDRL